ncbi:MAG: STAS domain-containing protein [Fimbriimonadia bacterium]
MIHQTCTVTSRVNGRTALITVDGCLDRTAPSAKEVIKEAVQPDTRIAILDLSHTPLLNSEGLDWLEEVRSQLEPKGVRLRVVAPAGGKVQRILRLMQYDKVVLLLHSLADAFRAGKRRYFRLRRAKKDTGPRGRPGTTISGQG